MPGLLDDLTRIAGDAFASAGLGREWGVVTRSDRPDLGEFQCNGALGAAKAAKTNPRALAESVAEALRRSGSFTAVSLAGPGFINLTLSPDLLRQHLSALDHAAKAGRLVPRAATPQTMMIDFGGANVAKLMHVGHLRSSVIGDCLQRLFRAAGHTVISDVHLGDWGTQMGQLITELARQRPDLPYFDEGFTGPYPETSPVTIEDLQRLYPEASSAAKADPARAEQARQATAALQAGRPGYRALWRHFVAVSITALQREFGSLGVRFDLWKGESDVQDLIPPMVADLKARALTHESEGAWIIPVARPDDKKELPPFLLLKSDGAALYETTDLATIIDRVRRYDPDLVLYVVDQRQRDHFEKVFRAAEICGLSGKAKLEHIGFGTVNGPDGRPFKTRAGDTITLYDLIAMATDEAAKRLAEAGLGTEMGEEERASIARQIGIGALKFADLSNNRVSDYVFDLARFTKFEGKTDPSLQYAAVRIKSLLRKAAEQGFPCGDVLPGSGSERELALQLLALPDAMTLSADRRAPNIMCDEIFGLAQSFSRFYAEHHILSEADEALRGQRLALARLTLDALVTTLDLLGIEVPDRM